MWSRVRSTQFSDYKYHLKFFDPVRYGQMHGIAAPSPPYFDANPSFHSRPKPNLLRETGHHINNAPTGTNYSIFAVSFWRQRPDNRTHHSVCNTWFPRFHPPPSRASLATWTHGCFWLAYRQLIVIKGFDIKLSTGHYTGWAMPRILLGFFFRPLVRAGWHPKQSHSHLLATPVPTVLAFFLSGPAANSKESQNTPQVPLSSANSSPWKSGNCICMNDLSPKMMHPQPG